MSQPTEGAPVRRFRVTDLEKAKAAGSRLTMLTAYDLPTARIFDAAGVDLLLVGDSLGDNMLGYDNTLPVTLDEMIPPARAVARGAKRAMVIVDLPFGTYEASAQQCLASAVRVMKETGAHAVKFEGGQRVVEQVLACTQAGIPVMGHLGFTPQSENILGGKKIQGRGDGAAEALVSDAVALQEAGAMAVVLEMVPAPVAAQVTEVLRIPTIGIGAGPDCDGQVLVWLDMAGMGDWSPRFAKRYADIGEQLGAAARSYVSEVQSGTYPDAAHSYDS